MASSRHSQDKENGPQRAIFLLFIDGRVFKKLVSSFGEGDILFPPFQLFLVDEVRKSFFELLLRLGVSLVDHCDSPWDSPWNPVMGSESVLGGVSLPPTWESPPGGPAWG